MSFLPLRLTPGTDLRRALEEARAANGETPVFVVSGIGSLVDASLRMADADCATVLRGPFEILSVAGTLTPSGAHLHMSVSDAQGRVFGGHMTYGNEIRTTAEVLLAWLPEWRLQRQFDAATGFEELTITRKPECD